MQERDWLRALKREIKMSREGKVKIKICIWERKERKKKIMKDKKKKGRNEKKGRGMARKI
jgi:hypothetical protein